jgi:23S rRNA pseudouridine2605 synthase
MPSPPIPAEGKRPLKTLERILSKSGMGSRTEARKWIAAGRAGVNGAIVRDPDFWVDRERDLVTFDGNLLKARQLLYLLLNKPEGYLTTFRDPAGRPTVYDLLPPDSPYLSHVGRLDLDSQGLLILTNDTAFAEKMTNPSHRMAKTYLVSVSAPLSDQQLNELRNGIELKDGVTGPAEVRKVEETSGGTVFEITITEGRNRQVRRMVEALGAMVLRLERTAIGEVAIAGLQLGKTRELTPDEVQALLA